MSQLSTVTEEALLIGLIHPSAMQPFPLIADGEQIIVSLSQVSESFDTDYEHSLVQTISGLPPDISQ